MGKSRNYIKILVANIIMALSLSFLPVCAWAGILIIKEGEIYQIINLLIIISACLLVYCMGDIWKSRIILGKCDFEAQEAFILKLLKRRGNMRRAELHLELLYVSLVLGRYDRSRQEIGNLHTLASRLNNRQRQRLQFLNIDYMISINKSELITGELEDAERLLEQLKGLKNRKRQKIQEDIRLRRYFIEEKWEEALTLLEEMESLSKNITIFKQVNIAYLRGKCYWQLGRYEEAYDELRFVIARGGNTKFVALANNLIERISDKNLYENKYPGKIKKIAYKTDGKILFLIVNCFMVLLLSGAAYYCSCGSSIEEAYGRRYLCGESRPFVIYSENINNYELAILDEGDKLGYCLLQKTPDSGYRIVDSFRIDQYKEENMLKELGKTREDIPESVKEFYLEKRLEQEIWAVITEFYRKNDIFHREDMEYVGFSRSSMVEHITINGKPISVERIDDVGETPIYFWRVMDINVKKNISIEYAGKPD